MCQAHMIPTIRRWLELPGMHSDRIRRRPEEAHQQEEEGVVDQRPPLMETKLPV